MIFRYPGGKSKKAVSEWILSHAPIEYSEYREPMVGGGGVFFRIDPSVSRWINDVHPGLMAVYKSLQDKSLVRRLRRIPIDDLRSVFQYAKKHDDLDSALRYFIINRMGYAGRVNYDIPSRVYFSNPSGWNIVQTDKMEKAVELLQGVRITCQDYAQVLHESGREVWIYIDPPYVKNTNLSKSSRLYQHSFEEYDHSLLAENINRCSHKVSISYDDCDLVRSLYSGFRIVENTWKYSGSSQTIKSVGREVLIMNY